MEPERVREQLDRILASATFSDAERASRFLRFVVERALDGHANEIKESVIAIEVLGRHSSFDSKADPIVRVEAGRLRDRLSSYYEGEGQADEPQRFEEDRLINRGNHTYIGDEWKALHKHGESRDSCGSSNH